MRLPIALLFAAAAAAAAASTAAATAATAVAAVAQVPRLKRRQTANSGGDADKAADYRAHRARRLDQWMAALELALLSGSGLALATHAHIKRRRDFFSPSSSSSSPSSSSSSSPSSSFLRGAGGGRFARTSLSQGSPFRRLVPPGAAAADNEPVVHSDVLQLSAEEQRTFAELQRVERRMWDESVDHYLAYMECGRKKGDIFGLPLVFRLMIKRQCLEERLADGLRLAPEPLGNAQEEGNLPRSSGAAAEEGQEGREDRPPLSGPMAVIKGSLSGAGQRMREAAAAYVKPPNPRGLAMRRSRIRRRPVSSGGLLRFARLPQMPASPIR